MCHMIHEHDQYVPTIWYFFHSIQYILHERVREERCKYKIKSRRVIEEETEELGKKSLRDPPS